MRLGRRPVPTTACNGDLRLGRRPVADESKWLRKLVICLGRIMSTTGEATCAAVDIVWARGMTHSPTWPSWSSGGFSCCRVHARCS